MAEQEPYQQPYSFTDIEQYLLGKLSLAQMHELEKAALQDPLLADAIDGYRQAGITGAREDLATVYSQISVSGQLPTIPIAIQQKKTRRLSVAAILVLLTGIGVIGLYLLNTYKPAAKTELAAPYKADSLVKAPETSVARNNTALPPHSLQQQYNAGTRHSNHTAPAPQPASIDTTVTAATAMAVELKAYPQPDSSASKDNAVAMLTNKDALEEVVIVGAGNKKSRTANMQASRIKSDTISPKTPMVPPPLEGKLPGVTVVGYGAVSKKDMTGSVTLHADSSKVGFHEPASISPRNGWPAFQQYILQQLGSDREAYEAIQENPFLTVKENPLSTFSIDVDAASYSNVRRILNNGQLPTPGAVRIEEMINYFHYEYPQPTGSNPFSVQTELAICPWNNQHQLALIGLQGRKIDVSHLPASNLVFLIDVSGSMFSPDKLPLVKSSLKLLVDQLRENDKVAIVAYAGNAGLVLPATSGEDKLTIKEAIDRLEAGGSTAGGAGIQLAYKVASENFVEQGNNRVILCTDGDFNVGASSDDALESLIEEKRKTGVYLTVLGYGTGNYQDAKMQKLADKGNGNHAYIDNISEAKKVLVNEFGGTLFTIAKDVKLQVEFNPALVKGYRLIGYENRMLSKEDFNDDRKDAGDLGSGHTVTALYEVIPAEADMPKNNTVDPLRYQSTANDHAMGKKIKYPGELMNVKLRYKVPDKDESVLLPYPVSQKAVGINDATENLRFAAAVASFGMLLRHSEYAGSSSFETIASLATHSIGEDAEGYRREFLGLVNKAASLSRKREVVRYVE